MAHKGFFKKISALHVNSLTKKNKHIKGFDCRQGKIKHMNKHIKSFNMSKIKRMRKNQGFSLINLMTIVSQTACLYDMYI